MKKKFLTIVVAGALALSFTACGDEAKNSTESATQQSILPDQLQEKLTPPDTEAPATESKTEAVTDAKTEDKSEEKTEAESEVISTESVSAGKTAEQILEELGKQDFSAKTMDGSLSMQMNMAVTYQGMQESNAAVNMDMKINGNKDIMYSELMMETKGASAAENMSMEYKYWVDNTNTASPVVYLNMGNVWYKTGSSSTPNVNIGTYTKYDPSAFKNLTLSETATDWIIEGDMDTGKLQGDDLNVMSGSAAGMPDVAHTVLTVDKAGMFVKKAEINMDKFSFEENDVKYDISKYAIIVIVNGYSDETPVIPADVISSATDIGAVTDY